MIFLLLFIFLPKLIRQAMKTDTETILDVFGKNEQFRKVFWTVFVALVGLVLAQVVDTATAESIVWIIAEIIP
jgi:ABC-type sulfate transport system permease component